jgi:hypothetical protein
MFKDMLCIVLVGGESGKGFKTQVAYLTSLLEITVASAVEPLGKCAVGRRTYCVRQCWGSVTFWCGSRSEFVDLYL